jgi:multiple sugar transport system ATP-binding protein
MFGNMARVTLDRLTKIFKGPHGSSHHAVGELNLEIQEGELMVLVGPSGCGKSTTLRLIAGLEEPTRGSVAFDGASVNHVPPERRDVAMVFQNHALYPHLTALENMALGLKLRKLPSTEINSRIAQIAALLGITPCLNKFPKELSGGERQRVAVGRALVRRPKIFLFDEPLSNLDAPTRAQFRGEIAKIHRRLGATILYVTHDQEEAMTLGNRIAVMHAATLQQVGAPLEVYQRPANQFVAAFLGTPGMNFFPGTLIRKGYTLIFCQHPAAGVAETETFRLPVSDEGTAALTPWVDREIILGLRPESIRVVEEGRVEAVAVAATVERMEPVGAEARVHLVSSGQPFIARAAASLKVQANDKVNVAFEMGQARFFDPGSGKAVG